MTLGPDLTIGSEADPLTAKGVYVGGEGTGDKDIAVMGGDTIYANQSGFFLERNGTGLLKLEFTKGKIISGGTAEGRGIRLQHKGEAGKEAEGIRIVSGADIDLSAHTDSGKNGIQATKTGAPADARHTENPGSIENIRFSGTRKEKGRSRIGKSGESNARRTPKTGRHRRRTLKIISSAGLPPKNGKSQKRQPSPRATVPVLGRNSFT